MIKDEYVVVFREDLNWRSKGKTFKEVNYYDFSNVLSLKDTLIISMIIFYDTDIMKYKIFKSRYFEI